MTLLLWQPYEQGQYHITISAAKVEKASILWLSQQHCPMAIQAAVVDKDSNLWLYH